MSDISINSESRKRKGGRPRIQNSRSTTISARVSAEEKALILKKLSSSGMTKSEALRLLILNDEIPKVVHRGVDVRATEAYQKIQPLQSNLNQIAKALNSNPLALNVENVKTIAQYVKFVEDEVKRLRLKIIDAGGQS